MSILVCSHVCIICVFSDYVGQLDQQYNGFIAHAYADSTSKNFLSSWTRYIDFLSAHRLQMYPPCYVNISRYLMHFSNKVGSYGTIANTISAIKKFYSLSGFTISLDHPLIDMFLKAAKRTKSSMSKPKSPLLIEQLLLIKNIVNYQDKFHHAFIVALVFQFFSCIRKSNLLPTSMYNFKMSMCLKRKDIVYVDGSLVVLLPWTKTLQNSDDIFTIVIAKSETILFDPVSMYMDFVHKFPVPHQNCPAFSFKHQGKIVSLSQSMYINHLKSYLTAIGVHPHTYSSHSVRRGGTSYQFLSGCPVQLIKSHGTWKSAAYQKYLTFNFNQKQLPTQLMFQNIRKTFGQ